MLRITVHDEESRWRMQLEGKLAGAWARQAAETWRSANPAGKPVEIDLTGVTVIDDCGLNLLREMKKSGAHLHTRGVKMSAVIGEVDGPSSGTSPCGWVRHLF